MFLFYICRGIVLLNTQNLLPQKLIAVVMHMVMSWDISGGNLNKSVKK